MSAYYEVYLDHREEPIIVIGVESVTRNDDYTTLFTESGLVAQFSSYGVQAMVYREESE